MIKNGPERVNIGGRRQLFHPTSGLLRRHVARRSEHIERISDRAFLFDQARQSKVGQMRFAFSIQQDIPGFNVAMQNAALVCELDRVRDLDEQLDRAPRRHRIATNDFIKVTAFDELHAEIAGAVAFADFINGHDLRVLQTRGRLRFVTKTS